MTGRLAVPLLGLTAVAVAGCGATSNQPTARQRDLGPAGTKILGGTADGRYLHVFSASNSTVAAGPPRFSATFLYVGTGSDRLVRVTTPLGTAALSQPLVAESAVPVDVPLRVPHAAMPLAATGSTVRASVRLAEHGSLALTVPIVGPERSPGPAATSSPS
jgi:hypothetical protein